MNLLYATVTLSALLCSLVAGFVLAFATVVMPGIQRLGDRDFLRAFKTIDRVIQNNQPVFMFVWLGSLVALVASALVGWWRLEGTDRMLIMLAAAVYVVGVQLPTAIVNVPLNNRLQAQDLDTATDASVEQARRDFEQRWMRWNAIRTVLATFTSAVLIALLLRL